MEFVYSRFCQFPFAAILSPQRCPIVMSKIAQGKLSPCYIAGYILTPADGNPLRKLTLVQQPNKKKPFGLSLEDNSHHGSILKSHKKY